MWTARDVTLFLRRELDFPRITVRLTPYRAADDKRWEVCEIRRRYFGPFQAGSFRFKEARDFLDPFYVHEGPGGEYLPLDPHLILAAVRQQDAWVAGNRPRSMVQRVRDAERRRLAKQSQLFEDIAVDSRRMVAQAADEMGL
jgi:hypothetical protein